MVKDEVTGDCFRADKLLEEVIDKYLANPPHPLSHDEQEKHRVIQVSFIHECCAAKTCSTHLITCIRTLAPLDSHTCITLSLLRM